MQLSYIFTPQVNILRKYIVPTYIAGRDLLLLTCVKQEKATSSRIIISNLCQPQSPIMALSVWHRGIEAIVKSDDVTKLPCAPLPSHLSCDCFDLLCHQRQLAWNHVRFLIIVGNFFKYNLFNKIIRTAL